MAWTAGIAILLAVLIGFRFGNLFLKPFELSLERKAYKSSRQYVEAKQTEMISLAEKIEGIESEIAKYKSANDADYSDVIRSLENQRDALISRLNRDANQVPAESVPRSAVRYID